MAATCYSANIVTFPNLVEARARVELIFVQGAYFRNTVFLNTGCACTDEAQHRLNSVGGRDNIFHSVS